jgi:lipopolysaccharide export system permease protein
MILTRLDRYIGRSLLTSITLVLSVMLAMTIFFVLVDALPDYGKGSFGAYEITRYVLLSQARQLYELFPMATLIGTLMALSALALNSELIAMRAAGVSVPRIMLAAMKTGLALILAVVLLGEFVVPTAENEAQLGRAQALATGLQQKGTGLWLRDGAVFVNIGEVLPDLSLLRLNIYQMDDQARLITQTSAQRAWYEAGAWRLEAVRESRIEKNRVRVRQLKDLTWLSVLTPEMVNVFSIRPEGLSMLQLARYIEHLRQNSQDTARFRLAFWQKLLLPFATAVMMLLAAPFVFRHFRSGGMSQRIFIGIMLGLTFVVLNRSFGYFGLIYGLPPVLGAAMPIVLFLLLALGLLRRNS